jgi:hypothetical protein
MCLLVPPIVHCVLDDVQPDINPGTRQGVRTSTRQFVFATMACDAALASRLASLLGRPFVRASLFVGSLATFTGDLFLSAPVHRRESAIFCCHDALLASIHVRTRAQDCNGRTDEQISKRCQQST